MAGNTIAIDDPALLRSLDRLSAAVHKQRSSLATNLNTLAEHINAFAGGAPVVGQNNNDLERLSSLLATAKRNEAAHEEGDASQQLRLELGLANEELEKRAKQIQKLEQKLREREGNEDALNRAEAELESRTKAHEVSLDRHRRAERELVQKLADAEDQLERLQDARGAAADAASASDELELALKRQRSRAEELAEKVSTLEAAAGKQQRKIAGLEEEVDDLREEKKTLREEANRAEESAALEIQRSSEMRAKLAEERSSRRKAEVALTQLQNERLQSSRTTAPTEDDDEDEVERLPPPPQQLPPPRPQLPPAAQSAAAKMAAEIESDDDDDADLARKFGGKPPPPPEGEPPPTAPPQRPQTPEAVTEEDDEDEVLPVELRLVGSLAPGGTARLQIFGGSAGRAGKSLTRDADGVEWFRVRQSGSKQRIANVTGGEYLCTSEDVGCSLEVQYAGRTASSGSLVAPYKQMLTLLQSKMQDDKFECAVEEAGMQQGRELTLVLTRKKCELLTVPNFTAATSGRSSKKDTKPQVVLSEAWSNGVAMRLLNEHDTDFTLTLGLTLKPKKRPPMRTLRVQTPQQRDLVLLAVASFSKPEWLQSQLQGAAPRDISFLITPSGLSSEQVEAPSMANAPSADSKGFRRSFSFGMKSKASAPAPAPEGALSERSEGSTNPPSINSEASSNAEKKKRGALGAIGRSLSFGRKRRPSKDQM